MNVVHEPSEDAVSAQLGKIVDDYLDRIARGQRPDIEQCARNHPELADVIRKILKHLDVWDPQGKPAPRAHAPPSVTALHTIDGAIPSAETLLTDIDYPVDVYC